MDPNVSDICKWIQLLEIFQSPRTLGLIPHIGVVCGFYLSILTYLDQNFRVRAKILCGLCFLLDLTCLLGQKFQNMGQICLWFVVFTCSYLLTWTQISGFMQKICAVCVFYLILLAYLAKNFRT